MASTKHLTKPPTLEADWKRLGAPGDAEFFGRLADSQLETIVTARRLAANAYEVDRIDEVLVPRVGTRIRAQARRFGAGFSLLQREEIEGEIIGRFWAMILGGEETMFEIAFNKTLRGVAIDAYRKVIIGLQRTRERNAARFDTTVDVDHASEARVIGEDEVSGADDFEDQLLTRIAVTAALDMLSPEERKAAILHFCADLKIFSGNAAERTVASELGCGERKARALIAEATRKIERMEHVLLDNEEQQ
jgi:DNA-directed RNA polymerase specialized sigma24 family protein